MHATTRNAGFKADIRIALMAAIAAASPARAQALPGFNLVPYPDSLTALSGALALPDDSRIFAADSSSAPLAALLSNDLFVLSGKRFPPVVGAAPAAGASGSAGAILLRLDQTLAADAYVLDIREQVEIRSGGLAGLGYGVTTFLQLSDAGRGGLQAPKARIADRPESPYRGLLVDIARQPHTLEGLKFFISYCRLYKVNHLQLHMTDDQGVTFPFSSVAGVNGSSGNNQNGVQAFTKAEWRELEAFASLRGVALVPEIEMPGHGGALVRNRPDLFRTGSAHPSTLNIANPAAVAALKEMVAEVCQTFRHTPYFHIGADEARLDSLNRGRGAVGVDPAVRLQWDARMDALTLSLRQAGRLGPAQRVDSAKEVYKDFVNQMGAHVKSLGKRPVMWEGFEPGGTGVVVDTAFVVMPFDIFYDPARYLDAGYRLVNASWTPLYIVNFTTDILAGIHPAVDSIYAWDKLAFDVVPRRVTPTSRIVVPEKYERDILGGHICIWQTRQQLDTAYIRGRLPAMAEKLWKRKAGLSYQDFQGRLQAVEPLAAKLVDSGRLPLPQVNPTGLRRTRGLRTGSAPGLIRVDGKRQAGPRSQD